MLAEGHAPSPANQHKDSGLVWPALRAPYTELVEMAVRRSVGVYTLSVVSAALLSWEVALGLPDGHNRGDLPIGKRTGKKD